MNIQALLSGQPTPVRCIIRTGRAEQDGVTWSEPREANLQLDRTPAGVISGVSLADEDFAEFDPRYHDEGGGQLVAEDHYLEIQQVIAKR